MSNGTMAAPAALVVSRILAPVDFSEPCRRAAECAAELARHFGAEVALLHATPPATLPLSVPEAMAYAPAPEFSARQAGECAELLESMIPAAAPHARRVLVENEAGRAIVEYAEQNRFDLIVMATHGYGALQRLVLGSVTAEVLRSAPCPVWTGAHYEAAPREFRTVVCAVDLETRTPAVLSWAVAFASSYGASVKIVHAIPMSTVRLGGVYFDPEWHLGVARAAKNRIEGMLRDASAAGEVSIEIGDVPDVVVAKLKDAAADLLVIGRGPHAYSLVRESPCPIVVV